VILSNTSIAAAFVDGRLSIDPQPTLHDTTAVDLHLANYYSLPKTVEGVHIDLTAPAIPLLETLTDPLPIPPEGLTLLPNIFILSQTTETIWLKLRGDLEGAAKDKPLLAARVEGKSSRARFGLLVHFTAPTVHAGYHGKITLEMINLGKWPLILKPDLAVCQLIIEEVDGDPSEGNSQFQLQTKPTGAQ